MELLNQFIPAAPEQQSRINLSLPFSMWVQFTKQSNLPNNLLSYDIVKPQESELSAEEIAAYLTPLFRRGLNATFIEGGEPLVRSDWQQLVAFMAHHSFTILRTNGTLLDDEAVDVIVRSNVGVVCVDIEGSCAATHDSIVGTPGAFEAAINGVRRLISRGVRTYVLCILTRRSAPELQRLADLAADLGVEKLGLLRLYPLGRVRRIWGDLAMSLTEQVSAIRDLQMPTSIRLMHSWHPYDPNCCWQVAAVDAYGNNVGCPYLRDFVDYGNVRTRDIMEMWDRPDYVERRNIKVNHSCVDCSSNDPNAEGGCRSTAYAFSGKWNAKDPYCSTMNDGVDLTSLPDWLQALGTRPGGAG